MSSCENNTSYYCPNYILSLRICIFYLHPLHYGGRCFHFDVVKKKNTHTHETKKEMRDGRQEKERGALAASY